MCKSLRALPPQIRDETISRLLHCRHRILEECEDATRDLVAGFGSTPSCSLDDDGDMDQGISEMHPGNYVFYDVQQWKVHSGQCHILSINYYLGTGTFCSLVRARRRTSLVAS